MAFIRRVVLQQFRKRDGPGMVHRRADDRFDGFKVQATRLAAVPKNDAQQAVYFARNFLLNRFSRFFSCGCGTVFSTGRNRQI